MLTLRTNNTNGNYQVWVRVANACDAGGSAAVKNTYLSGCYGYYIVSPNPATSTVNISVSTNTSSPNPKDALAAPNQSSFSEINIYDEIGNLKKHKVFNKIKSTILDIRDLPTGIYTIEVIQGTYKERKQLQVLK